MSDIARRAGVSRAAVSSVLNGSGAGSTNVRVAEETRERILAAARELNYRPNGFARGVRSGRFGMVALLLAQNSSASLLPRGVLYGIHEALAAADLHLLVTILPDDKLTDEEFVPKILRESTSDGLLINYNAMIPPRLAELIRRHRVPAVWINSRHEADCVYPDDFAASRDLTARLLGLGHRRVAYVDAGSTSHYSGADRYAGYAEAMRAAGLESLPTFAGFGAEGWFPFFRDWLRGFPASGLPTAAVVYNPDQAASLMAAAAHLGLRLPADLSVATFAPTAPFCQGLRVEVMSLPDDEIGRVSVELLRAKMASPDVVLPPRPVPLRLLPGQSCGPPPT